MRIGIENERERERERETNTCNGRTKKKKKKKRKEKKRKIVLSRVLYIIYVNVLISHHRVSQWRNGSLSKMVHFYFFSSLFPFAVQFFNYFQSSNWDYNQVLLGLYFGNLY